MSAEMDKLTPAKTFEPERLDLLAIRNGNLKHHKLSEIFPLVEGEEFNELVADIKAHGLREPITLYRGEILDGRNRYHALLKAGTVPIEEKHFLISRL